MKLNSKASSITGGESKGEFVPATVELNEDGDVLTIVVADGAPLIYEADDRGRLKFVDNTMFGAGMYGDEYGYLASMPDGIVFAGWEADADLLPDDQATYFGTYLLFDTNANNQNTSARPS